MRTKRPNTLQQKLGFLDDDLKKPKHDDLMLWLDKNIEKILNEWHYKVLTDKDYSELLNQAKEKVKLTITDRKKAIDRFQEQLNYYSNKKEKSDFDLKQENELKEKIEKENKKIQYLENWKDFTDKPALPKLKVNAKIWELPVTTQSNGYSNNSSKYTVGFIDVAVHFILYSNPFVNGFFDDSSNEYGLSKLKDLKEKIHIDFYSQQHTIYIEVKTEISSLGELIRQIRHYKEYLPGTYYVLCPDDKYADTLKEQNIGFINYQE